MTNRHSPPIRGLVALLLLALGSSCGTDAVGVEACREVEYARCQAAVHCGLVQDVRACELHFRDHCLHGVALEEGPSRVAVRECVEVIESAGECADDRSPRTDPDECGKKQLEGTSASQVCDIVDEPQRAPACAFLDVEPETDEEDDNSDEEPQDEGDPASQSDAGAADGG